MKHPSPVQEELALDPRDRYETMLETLRSAQRSIRMSIFRCDDPGVIRALTDAQRRGVDVRVLITNRAKGSTRQLNQLHRVLTRRGVVAIRYAGPFERYHAKYVVVDDSSGLICTMNLTADHFGETHDLVFMTSDAAVIAGLSEMFDQDWLGTRNAAHSLPPRLIVSPDRARARFSALIRSAAKSIVIVDHKLSDARMRLTLAQAARRGVEVTELRDCRSLGLRAHAKIMLIDERIAVVGSMALSADTLEHRRDLAILIDDVSLTRRLLQHLAAMERRAPARSAFEDRPALV
jgi:phosphatidylserine/phosphatidylglycerophosphate/cardiolipin synthase-like enzyme